MKHSIWPLAAALVLVFAALAGIAYYYYAEEAGPEQMVEDNGAAPLPPPARETRPPASPRPLAELPEPVPPQPAIPLPPLDDSDDEAVGSLVELIGAEPVERFLIPDDLIRNLVVTVDNLPRPHASERQRPVAPAPGQFLVAGTEEARVLNPENYDRYTPLVRLLQAADTRTVVAVYRRLYPLMREAYEELGHPEGNFHLRVLEVIDHLLETPQLSGPIRLAQPNVLYEFADEDLESRSAGQKLLLRMGPENAEIVMARLRELRDELI